MSEGKAGGVPMSNRGAQAPQPAGELLGVLALVDVVVGQQLLLGREERIVEEYGGEGVAEFTKYRVPGYMRFHVILG